MLDNYDNSNTFYILLIPLKTLKHSLPLYTLPVLASLDEAMHWSAHALANLTYLDEKVGHHKVNVERKEKRGNSSKPKLTAVCTPN